MNVVKYLQHSVFKYLGFAIIPINPGLWSLDNGPILMTLSLHTERW